MAVVSNHIGDGEVGGKKISANVRKHRYFYDRFMDTPKCWTADAATFDGAPTGSDGAINAIFTGNHTFTYTAIGTQTLLAPLIGTGGGYNFALDQTAADGWEVNFGSLLPAHPRVYQTGTDEFYCRLRFHIEDASGADFFFGFRGGASIAATGANIEAYTDIVGLRVLGVSEDTATATITFVGCINDASVALTSSTLSTTIADLTPIEFEVRVQGLTASALINGVDCGVNFTLDTGDYFTPVVDFLHTTDVAGEVTFLCVEGGLLSQHPDGLLP